MNTSEKVIVTVSEGKIHGIKNRSTFSGIEFYSFLGVPYGQSTAGHARFKDPVEVKPWKNILDATTIKGGCFQFTGRKREFIGSEDCLYNNIHTPQLPRKNYEQTLKAVIVCIHPGSFYLGTPDPDEFGSPDFVMHNNVVYVVISYRLHILGFLNLNLKECSGNQGIKDIILSLKWIQKNISNFGGDPNNITLIGTSSGAQLVHFLTLSPRAKGLFHKAVIMGSYKYHPSSIIRGHNSTIACEMAQNLGYDGPCDEKNVLKFYKKLDLEKFILTRPERSFLQGCAPFFLTFPFVPTCDFGENPVIPKFDKQKELESMARIPLIIGFCEREAVLGFLPPFMELSMKNYYQSIRQNCWGWGSKLTDSQLEYLKKRIELFYLNGNSIENASMEIKCDIQTDISLSDVYTSFIDVVAADLPSSIFVYKFEFEGNVIRMKDVFNYVFKEIIPGTFHSDDYSYWSHIQHPDKMEEPLSPLTKKIVNVFTKLICTFAETGNPNYEGVDMKWESTTVKNPCYLSINNDLQMVEGKVNGKRMEFWENLKREMETNDLTDGKSS